MLKQKEIVETEIMNFILFFTSDDKEREDMQKVADSYMNSMFEEHN